MVARTTLVLCLCAAACGDSTQPLQTAKPGVIFSFPIEGQIDVPLGARIVVMFSDPIDASAIGSCSGFCVMGPSGPIAATAAATADGKGVEVTSPNLDPGTTYQVIVTKALAPNAENLPASGPLFSFTTRSERPRAAPPALIALNGSDPAKIASTPFRPLLDTSTIRLVFSEPMDPRTVIIGPGAIELVDSANTPVPATLVARGIHAAIDPVGDLMAGATYQLRLGSQLKDLGGQPLPPSSFTLTPADTKGGKPPIAEVMRTRQMNDPGTPGPRAGTTPNVINIDKPLIGKETTKLLPVTLAAEIGDPKALEQIPGAPLAFTMRRGQRLKASGLDVALGGTIPVGLSTGDIQIELVTDGGGRIYRNPYQDINQRPENDRAPLYVDFSLDVAVWGTDPEGNAVLAQTVSNIEATGIATATDGVLDIEAVTSMDLGLLGVTSAPSNLVLELVTDPNATVDADHTAPTVVATYPGANDDLPVDTGVELIFSEPIDLDRARAGGIKLQNAAGAQVPAVIESHGSTVVVRPIARLAYSSTYRVVLSDVADLAGNALAMATSLVVTTPNLGGTGVPTTVVSSHPGAPCALTGATGTNPGRCAGGDTNDDLYAPFTLPANDVVSVAFSQPLNASTAVLGTSVRVESLDGGTAAVPGTLIERERSVVFVPDTPWTVGNHYRLTLTSGGNASCDASELCGLQDAASFDPLNGTTSGDGGGAALVMNFTATAPTDATLVTAAATPFTDVNGSGYYDGNELPADANRATLHITGSTGSVSNPSFQTADCTGVVSGTDACLYLNGGLPVAMQPVAMNCALPDGSTAPSCVPVTLSPQAMYGTSVDMNATMASVFSVTEPTGTSIMRIREPATGPVQGYIIDKNGPTLVLALNLYMDAPDLSLPLSSHDLHSKPLSVSLEGPVSFLPDGRISIAAHNTADVPLSVRINAPLGISGTVEMTVPAGEMKLQLVTAPLRGAAP